MQQESGLGGRLADNVAADAGKLPRRLHMADARWLFELLGLLDAEQGDGDPGRSWNGLRLGFRV